MIFQMMFAVITPALIIGAFAERMKFSRVLRLHAAVGDARLRPGRATGSGASAASCGRLGALDFAGGTVVHINAGMAALAAALVLGKRMGYPDNDLAAAQPALRGPRRGAAVVRLVRLQRRQRARRRTAWRPAPSWRRTSAAAAAGLTWAAAGLDRSTSGRPCWA